MRRLAAWFGVAIFLGGTFCGFARPASPARGAERVERMEWTSLFAVGTIEHDAAVAWLKARKSEGQLPDLPSVDVDHLGNLIVTRATSRISPVDGNRGDDTPTIILPDPSPGQLPGSGKEGDTYAYSSCTAGGAKYTYEFKWDPAANNGKGGWVITKITYQAMAQTCA